MPLKEYFLGYDVREMFLDPGAFWTQERRDQYLLRLDVKKPLSVDCAVWPYFFDPCSSKRLLDWRIGCHDLWDDLEILKIFMETEDNDPARPFNLIGVTLTILSYGDAEVWSRGQGKLIRDLQARSLTVTPSWKRLGYDVADAGMISSLSNCGFLPEMENVWAQRERWARWLNEHHLFDNPEDAEPFRQFSNIRVEEHAPFFIYGLYRVGPERTS